ncbi:glutaminase family protein [Xylanibacter brevis]|uniref:glutaminase family protein n=1 Tax=Xylanibacter brevis TaxID=83231 RepID=UPI0004841D53|nr:glutaminase family protein [Xylanibacter brevis]
MKKAFLFGAMILGALATKAQSQDTFKPYQPTDLRLPSVPLIVSDPYFSVWSPYNELNEGTTRHWTNDEKPMQGFLRVDGQTYCFMGADRDRYETIIPMANEEAWTARYSREKQAEGWQENNFNDSKWAEGKAAFGSEDLSNVRTRWSNENSDLYVRRTINIDAKDLNEDLALIYSHDDVFEIYINGTKVASTGEIWREGVTLKLDSKLKKLLKPGKNIIAAHCHNTTGGAYTDFGIFKIKKADAYGIKQATQKSVDVLATSSYYTFTCGPVELDLVFTAPMLIDDYDLLSAPANYISYQVRSTDGQAHNVQLMLTASPLMAVNKGDQPTISSIIEKKGTKYACTGTIEQPILAKTGDGICIDWGYFYLPAINGDVAIASENALKSSFVKKGNMPASQQNVTAQNENEMPSLAYCHNFGTTKQASSYAIMGYDEIWDIEYFYKRYKGYWAHEGSVTIFDMIDRLNREYSGIMKRCRQLDKQIYDDGMKAGNKQYAEILSGSYRHVIAAHKLFRDDEGNLLFFSKENNSNGCVNTVDLTYPEAPLFLCYNPELQKGMMTSIFEYSYTGRWTKPFAAHDLGQYPKANKQVYGGDMPLEEAGNMLTLAAMICKLDGNTSYVNKYWDIITTWADYLSENGQDPSNQLCTDDFAGHWAHNANLSVKAIMGVAAYAEMARLKGLNDVADKYMARAKEMATIWERDAREDDHYRLAFDRKDTWSQKYNMVWDKLWNLNLFPNGAMERDMKYYLTKQNKYGLPLDVRRDYTKSDWIMWTAAMAKDKKTFLKFVDPLYKYINETESRVPISDWHDTKTGIMTGFKARSVIGGYWMKVLADKLQEQ